MVAQWFLSLLSGVTAFEAKAVDDDAAEALAILASEKGSEDNITVVVVSEAT